MENKEYIENNNSQNEAKSNKNSEFSNKVSEASSSGQFTFKSNKKNVIDYDTAFKLMRSQTRNIFFLKYKNNMNNN